MDDDVLCDCGERMWLEDPHALMLDYLPGSPQIRALFEYGIEYRGVDVWACYGCGLWLPTVIATQ